jgi:hypothetical protein
MSRVKRQDELGSNLGQFGFVAQETPVRRLGILSPARKASVPCGAANSGNPWSNALPGAVGAKSRVIGNQSGHRGNFTRDGPHEASRSSSHLPDWRTETGPTENNHTHNCIGKADFRKANQIQAVRRKTRNPLQGLWPMTV